MAAIKYKVIIIILLQNIAGGERSEEDSWSRRDSLVIIIMAKVLSPSVGFHMHDAAQLNCSSVFDTSSF